MRLSCASFLAGVAMMIPSTVTADVVLSQKIMKLARTGAELSSLAYIENPEPKEEYEMFEFFDEEPDQALVVKIDGYCYGAFRGTTLTWIDWQQNFELGNSIVCTDNDPQLPDEAKEDVPEDAEVPENCCSTRIGFFKAYNTGFKTKFEEALRSCAATCEYKDECVVLTGHSQGGAIAAVAGVVLDDLNPYVITFGQPATIDAPCPVVTTSRWYRFVNTKQATTTGLSYDPVPFVPGMGADSLGHMIIVSEDPTGVAYIGLDAQDSFGPLDTFGFEAHSMIHAEGSNFAGYTDRLDAILANTTFPVRADGFSAGTLCSQDKECMSGICKAETSYSFKRCVGVECDSDDDCESGRCDSGSCIPKLGSCFPCDEDSDCSGGKCLLFKCSGESGKMDDECICKWDEDCASGRCELFQAGQCEAKLALGARCDESSDCESGYCSWGFRCGKKPEKKEKKPRNGGGFLIFMLIVLILIGSYYGYKKLRRGGYQDVPTELNV